MERQVIQIDQEKCTGCGQCVPGCPEGALQIIDGKARLVSDLFCDGLGACLGECPEGAISVVTREAERYDEKRVMENIIPQGTNTLRAHLQHLRDHDQTDLLTIALTCLQERGIPNPLEDAPAPSPAPAGGGCPGSRSMAFTQSPPGPGTSSQKIPSALTHWPIQLHLLSPRAAHYQKSDLLLAADCTAFALGRFHTDYLARHTLAIACPKLDEGQDVYLQKLRALVDEAGINTLTVVIMQVPCCGGLLRLAQQALQDSRRKVPLKCVVVGIEGEILREEWL